MTADYRQNPTPETNVPVVFSKPVLPFLPSFSPCLRHGYDVPCRGDFTVKEYVMNVKFNSLFEIYPDKLRKGAVVGFIKADGTRLEFPCTIDTGDAVKDAKGRWTASSLGLTPVVAKTGAREAWIGDGFCKEPDAKYTVDKETIESVRFVDDVTSIGEFAFSGCTALTNITIPKGVKSIGYGAFSGCVALTDITIPKTIEKIGDMAFYRCTELTSITIPKGVTVIGDWAFKVVLALPASRVRIVSRKSESMRSTVATA